MSRRAMARPQQRQPGFLHLFRNLGADADDDADDNGDDDAERQRCNTHSSAWDHAGPNTFIRHLDEALGDDPRIALAAVRQLIATDLPWLELRAVRHARAHGYEWARVGRLLGRSRQAVRAKYKSDRPVRFELADDEQRLRRLLADIQADAARRAELEAWEQQTDVVPW